MKITDFLVEFCYDVVNTQGGYSELDSGAQQKYIFKTRNMTFNLFGGAFNYTDENGIVTDLLNDLTGLSEQLFQDFTSADIDIISDNILVSTFSISKDAIYQYQFLFEGVVYYHSGLK